jgi:two-component system, cell cycle sensor histidine kinase and response regulator CckA
VILPGLDGWSLSRELVRARPALPVLFVSGYAAQPTGEPLLPDGVPLLPKPFTPEDLLRAVRRVLDGDAGAAGAQGAGAAADAGARTAKRNA